ncbi:MAG: PEGA domain-containing protein, partial [Gemmatimonadaceae bacterium]
MRTRIGAALLIVATWTSSAYADDAIESARAHFADGVARFEAGDYEAACALFRRADSEHHAPEIVYNVARSEERLDHPQAAVESYDAYLREAGETGEFATAAALALAQIRGRSPRVHIETAPPGAHVFVDGIEAPGKSPTSTLVTLGHHQVVAEGEGWH